MDFAAEPDRFRPQPRPRAGSTSAALPESWRLGTIGIVGRLTGSAHLRLVLDKLGLDLTGSTGAGAIDGAVVRGFPLRPARARRSGARGSGRRPAEKQTFLPQWVGADFEVRDAVLDRARRRPARGGRRAPGLGPALAPGWRPGSRSVRSASWGPTRPGGRSTWPGPRSAGLDLGRLDARVEPRRGRPRRGRPPGAGLSEGPARRPTGPPPADGPLAAGRVPGPGPGRAGARRIDPGRVRRPRICRSPGSPRWPRPSPPPVRGLVTVRGPMPRPRGARLADPTVLDPFGASREPGGRLSVDPVPRGLDRRCPSMAAGWSCPTWRPGSGRTPSGEGSRSTWGALGPSTASWTWPGSRWRTCSP